jgi:sulfide:quinone oxidoreductase
MTDFTRVTPDFAVAPQLTAEGVAAAAAAGFRTIIGNRPDGEAPGQLPLRDVEAAAKAAGLNYKAIPFSGPPPPAAVAETADFLETAPGPVLAYCRTGTRSITVWAMAQALAGKHSPDELIALARQAGYDLSGARDALARLAPG